MIADRLKQLRKKNQYTQEELASQLNISRQAISNWENEKAYPDLDNLILLSNLYNISIDNLINASDPNSEKEVASPTIKTEYINKKELPIISRAAIILFYFLVSMSFPFLDIIIFALNVCQQGTKKNNVLSILFKPSLLLIVSKALIVFAMILFIL